MLFANSRLSELASKVAVLQSKLEALFDRKRVLKSRLDGRRPLGCVSRTHFCDDNSIAFQLLGGMMSHAARSTRAGQQTAHPDGLTFFRSAARGLHTPARLTPEPTKREARKRR